MTEQLKASLVVGEKTLLDLEGTVDDWFIVFSKVEGDVADMVEGADNVSEFYEGFYEALEYATIYVKKPGERLSQGITIKPYEG